MATGLDLTELHTALPSLPSDTHSTRRPRRELTFTALLWNIDGEGKAKARKLLLQEVVDKANTDLVLLQEINAKVTIEEMKTRRQYNKEHILPKKWSTHEAAILFDRKTFAYEYDIKIAKMLEGKNVSGLELRQGTRRRNATPMRDAEFYSSRTLALKLRAKFTTQCFIVVSFHNSYTSHEQAKANVKEFYELIKLIAEQENVPIICGCDFNWTPTDVDEDIVIPPYEKSSRRVKSPFDYFVLHFRLDPRIEVRVFEALPLVDHTSTEADDHVLKKAGLRTLSDTTISIEEFNKVTKHDPIMIELTFENIPICED